jgi:hypothetical protein
MFWNIPFSLVATSSFLMTLLQFPALNLALESAAVEVMSAESTAVELMYAELAV